MNLSILVTDDTLEEVLDEVNRVEDFVNPKNRITLEEVKGNRKLFAHLMTGGTVTLDNNMKPSLRINVGANYELGNYDDLYYSRMK